MDIEKEKKRTKKWIVVYIIFGVISLIAVVITPMFLILTAVFWFIAFLIFKDLKKFDKNNVQEVVTDNLETKQINTEVEKMQISNEEKAEMLETLSRDEDVILFLKVTKGQVKYGLLEKMRTDIEAKPKKKEAEAVKETKKESEEEDEDIVVEED